MLDIALAVAVFTIVVLLLVGLLMQARRRLVPSGDVSIVINDDPGKALKVAVGGTLLGALSDNKIFIPSACGGKGSCGVCEVVVKEGGGDLLPTTPTGGWYVPNGLMLLAPSALFILALLVWLLRTLLPGLQEKD